MSGEVPDLSLQGFNAFGQAVAEGGKRLPVDQEAGLLHLGEYPAERHLDLLKESGLPVGLQFFPQDWGQRGHRRGAVEAPVQIALGQIRQLIGAVRGPQQISRQRRVEHEAVSREGLAVQAVHQVLHVVRGFPYFAGEEQSAEGVVFLPDLHPAQMADPFGVLGKAKIQLLRAALRQDGDKGRVPDPLRQGWKLGRRDGNPLRLLFLRRDGGGIGFAFSRLKFLQTPLVDHPPEAQTLHERQQFRCPLQ